MFCAYNIGLTKMLFRLITIACALSQESLLSFTLLLSFLAIKVAISTTLRVFFYLNILSLFNFLRLSLSLLPIKGSSPSIILISIYTLLVQYPC